LIVDENDRSYHPLFFDDNIRYGEDTSILDVRTLSGELIPDKSHQDIFSVRVVPPRVALNEKYYIEKVNMCENNFENMK